MKILKSVCHIRFHGYLATSNRLESMKYFFKMLDMDKKQFNLILTVLVKYNANCGSQYRKNE